VSERSDATIAGKVALVTGGARGLGAATARSLSAAGARVFVVDQHHPDAGEPFDEQVTFLVGDVTDLDAMTRAVETVRAQAGHLDIVIANAGLVADNDSRILVECIDDRRVRQLVGEAPRGGHDLSHVHDGGNPGYSRARRGFGVLVTSTQRDATGCSRCD